MCLIVVGWRVHPDFPLIVAANRDELLGYGFSEEILYYRRRWFVVLEYADDVLSCLLAQRKPVKDLTNCDETQRK